VSGFVGRVVSRALAPERVLRPRVHSAYESFAQGGFEEIAVDAPSRTAVAPVAAAPKQEVVREERVRVVPTERVETREMRSVELVGNGGIEREERERERVTERVVAREPHAERPHDEPAPAAPPETIVVERDVVMPPETRTIVRSRRGVDRLERLRLHSERRTTERDLIGDAPVEITIGRIDVRAVVESPRDTPRATSRAAAPSLSLRDYLAQRDARRRR
jgi:hypothetical protein